MAKNYVSFSCVGVPTDPSKCTTRWPEDVTCSIPIGGEVEGTFYNLMIMESVSNNSITAWLAANAGKVEQIDKSQADALGQAIVPSGTEVTRKDPITGVDVTMVAGAFNVDSPVALWTVKA